MTAKQIALIKKSWRTFNGINPTTIGDAFYTKLFSDNPSLRKLFAKDMESQFKKLIDMLHAIVIRLDHLEEVTDDIKAMAVRHVGYGVRPAHYKLVGNALLWTLEVGMGDAWTEELENAWTECYSVLSNTMIKAAYEK